MDCATQAERVTQLYCGHLREIYQVGEALAAQGEEGVLLCLRQRAGEPVLSGELMAMMGLTTGRVANILRQMEKKGLIRRRQGEGDRRCVFVSLTEAGARRAEEKYREIAAANRRILEYLGETDSAELARLLERCLSFIGGRG